ncbi:hypothetical protein ACOMHN_001219 [Nucella lapillus]
MTIGSPRQLQPMMTIESPRQLQLMMTIESPRQLQPMMTIESPRQLQPMMTIESPRQLQPMMTIGSPRQLQPMMTIESPRQLQPMMTIGSPRQLQPMMTIGSPRQLQPMMTIESPLAVSRQLLALEINCTPRAVEQFPGDFLTEGQRRAGLIVIHILITLYMFMGLALVCDRYFIPSLEILCELMKIETDIAGATLMAAGSSAPELATSVIGVFVAQDDVGLGTVVGSAIYNVMFVISMCALFATSAIHLHWWPMVRDCMAYLFSVLALIFIIYDAVVQWYEAVILIVMYALYVLFMYFNERLEVWCVPRVNMCCCYCSFSNHKSDANTIYNKLPTNGSGAENGETTHLTGSRESDEESSDESDGFVPPPKPNDHAHQEAETWHKLCERPEGCLWSLLWLLALPLSTAMFVTVPDCRRPSLRRWFLVTFLLSLVWLSAFSFLMVWMITVIGYTANIPDSVMSLTFIAFGVSLPDVVASVLVVRDGLGDMAVSNAIGSNVFDILVCLGMNSVTCAMVCVCAGLGDMAVSNAIGSNVFDIMVCLGDMAVSNAIGSNVFDILVCLGIPWFLETCVIRPGSQVTVYSEGLVYSSLMLLSTVALLLIATHINGWRLTKKYGLFLLVVYVAYTVMASLYELNVFGYFHPPECPSKY